jgi:hypothetical protein
MAQVELAPAARERMLKRSREYTVYRVYCGG